jgi:pSer/pThr/pTyr-binding forkhead associated (FHA) protein
MIRPSRATSQPATDPRPALVPAGRFDAQPPFYLDRPVTLIGSRHRAHVRLESDEVSRSHAIVVNTQGRVFIRDLGSRTRVYVNGRETWETQLADGDYVTIGHFSFRFSAGDTSRSARPVNGAAAAMLTGTTLAAGGVALDRAVCVIGCRQGADLLLRGSAVSFAHAVIVRHEAGHLVRDLGSRTGTFLNGAAIEGDAELLPGCVLRVGPYEMKYATAAAGAAAAPTAPPPDTVAAAPRYWDTTTYAGVLGDHADDSGTLTPAAAEPTPAAAAPVADSIPVAPDPVTPVAPEAVPAEPVAAEAAPAEAELPPEMDGVAELEAWAASAGDTPAFVEPVPPAQPPAPAKAPAAEAAKSRRARKKPVKQNAGQAKGGARGAGALGGVARDRSGAGAGDRDAAARAGHGRPAAGPARGRPLHRLHHVRPHRLLLPGRTRGAGTGPGTGRESGPGAPATCDRAGGHASAARRGDAGRTGAAAALTGVGATGGGARVRDADERRAGHTDGGSAHAGGARGGRVRPTRRAPAGTVRTGAADHNGTGCRRRVARRTRAGDRGGRAGRRRV